MRTTPVVSRSAFTVSSRGRKSMSRMLFLSQNTVHITFRKNSVCLNSVLIEDSLCLLLGFRGEVRSHCLIAHDDHIEELVAVIVISLQKSQCCS
ncbi:hypothetical protein TNCV_4172021 [Trichonephila clavipes]|nr:hypothetical protein TNCV_4172021 [Trichonephila clavipes]